MQNSRNNTLPQSYNRFFEKIIETYSHFTRSAANQNYFIARVVSSLVKRNSAYQRAVACGSAYLNSSKVSFSVNFLKLQEVSYRARNMFDSS